MSQQSQFYALNFINSLNMKKMQINDIKELIEFLFGLFKKLLEVSYEEIQSSKLMMQLLKGLNKLFPIAKQNYGEFKQFFEEKINNLFKIVHMSENFKIRIQTLLFIFQI